MRIIINNASSKSDIDALKLVSSVIEGGLISDFGKAYCYATVFSSKKDQGKTSVYAVKNSEHSHTFNVSDRE